MAAADAEVHRHTAAWSPDAYASALERYLALGGADLEHRARTVCADLGLSVSLDQETATLSGGEAARAGLAAILLSRFDLLLLDEPTNDLDFDGLEVLERFLATFPGGLAVVSHDRAFLDRTVERIAEIDPWTHTVSEFAGGWTEYEQARDLARSRQYEAFERSQERRREVEALLNERRSQARAGGGFLAKETGGADRRGTHALKMKVRQAARALERVDQVEKPYEPWRLQLSFGVGQRSGDRVVTLDGAVARRGASASARSISTSRRASASRSRARTAAGRRRCSRSCSASCRSRRGRERSAAPRSSERSTSAARPTTATSRLLATFRERTSLPPETARTLLAKFNLGAEHVERACATLSPGERTRAHLAELQASGVNCLVLDEPTNHLDLEAIEELESALAAYEGTAVVVSHDRRFLERVAPTRFIAL